MIKYFKAFAEKIEFKGNGLPELFLCKEIIDMVPFHGFDIFKFYCSRFEMQVISLFCLACQGNYLEIGVNRGETALNVCRNNPDKIIYGVDLINESTMHPEQLCEKPNSITVAFHVLKEPNFNLMLQNSREIKLPHNIGFVFIDGDHTYEGVKADTENILKQVKKETLIFWHDYGNNNKSMFMGVERYLHEISGFIYPEIYHINNTFLACAVI